MQRLFARVALGLSFSIAGCTTLKEQPLVLTAPGEHAVAAVVRQSLPLPEVPIKAGKEIDLVVPRDLSSKPLYLCVNDTKIPRLNVSISFMPRVEKLCRQHPEMGPCQYEREACRRSGGRVYTADGTEITLDTESEYDKHVMRVRFRAN